MNPADLSVIVPVYNGARFLRDAIASVTAQGFAPMQIIIVDDGSTDDTPAVVRSLAGPIHSVRQENHGPSSARNLGIRAARTEMLAFIDADDLWPTDKLAHQVPVLAADRSIDVVMGYTQAVSPAGSEPIHGRQLSLSVGASLFRRSAFERYGFFDESFRAGEDLDWLLRAREAGARIDLVNTVTLLYRENPGSLSHGKSHAELNFFRILKRSLDRRREEGVDLAPLRRPAS